MKSSIINCLCQYEKEYILWILFISFTRLQGYYNIPLFIQLNPLIICYIRVLTQVEDEKILKITGETRMMKKEDNWHHYERSSGKFFTSFSLPLNSRADYVKSSMENGVLTITIPKKEISRNHHHIRSVQIN